MSNKNDQSPNALDLIRSKAKFQLFSYFLIHHQISSRDLRLWTGKAKSTIFKHLKDMEALGFIKQMEFRDKDGNSLYCLAENFEKQFENIDSKINLEEGLAEETIAQICQTHIDINKTFISYLNYKVDFLQSLLQIDRNTEKEKFVKIGNLMIHSLQDEEKKIRRDNQGYSLFYSELMNNFSWYSEEEWKVYLIKFLEFSQNIEKDSEWIKAKKQESSKSILFFGTTVPLKRMLESQVRLKE